jgi:DNA polymerase III alpha subunit
MSTKLIDLKDRIITDEGEVVAKHDLLVKKALSGEVFTELRAVYHPDIEKYNDRTGHASPIAIWKDTGEDSMMGPSAETFDWTVPKKYLEMDIIDLCIQALYDKRVNKDEYVNRMSWELRQMEEKNMYPFVRCLLYVTDMFRDKGIVWGVGRGSSCASLVLYLLNINKVDPLKYNIPPEEFFK